MDAIHQLEILWVILIQSIGPWLIEPMRIVSLLGNEEFYLLMMPLLYWSVDARLGFRVAILLLLSNGVATFFKFVFHAPRPYWLDQRIQAFSVESSFGIPSGHAQNAVAIWGFLTTRLNRKWQKILLISFIVLIGFSRIYLGVHFISDVILGWFLGGLLLWSFLRLEKMLGNWLRARSLSQMLQLALVSSLLLGLFMLLPSIAQPNLQVPDAWIVNASAANPNSQIDPLNSESAFTVAGTWFGMMAGVAWLFHKQGGFQVSKTPVQRILCYLIGVIGIFFFWYILGAILPRNSDVISYTLRYLRYTMIGLWVSAAAPVLFQRLGLNSPHKAMPASLPT